ncbi:MAG: right-handed parallel beta-helix repeat-containing protein [Verrucomicrobiota bacterium]
MQTQLPKTMRRLALANTLFPMLVSPILATEITVNNAKELREEAHRAKPGTTIQLAPGNYGNGVRFERIAGTEEHPIVITGADEENPPVFEGGNQGMHFVDCNYVTLRHVQVTGCKANGINADDGGSYDSPSVGMVFENVTVENIGPQGNFDGLKISGLKHFTVRNCRFSGWGGGAIDMVGCREGLIEGCEFVGKEGFSQTTGIQAKGGTENVRIRTSYFHDAGLRSINLGGSTGLAYFRPKVQDFEARGIVVEGNHFVGSVSPFAFATSRDCVVRQNMIVFPKKWVLRILQEQPLDQFKPCQGGVFEANLIVFDNRVQSFVNIGPDTLPETFTFRKNAWFSADSDRRPTLPTDELEGIYQVDPKLENAETPEMKMLSKDPRLQSVGAQAFRVKEF